MGTTFIIIMGMCTNDFVIGNPISKTIKTKIKKNVTLNGKYLVLDFMIPQRQRKKMISRKQISKI